MLKIFNRLVAAHCLGLAVPLLLALSTGGCAVRFRPLGDGQADAVGEIAIVEDADGGGDDVVAEISPPDVPVVEVVDAPVEVEVDAFDVPTEVPPDVPVDVAPEIGPDIVDARPDAPPDVPADVPPDVPTDVPGCIDRDFDMYGIGASCLGPDCNDMDSRIYPGAPEICNGSDDNCNGVVDEGFMPQVCGTGVCQRSVPGCSAGTIPACVPGTPSPEICNGLDDDCNGVEDDALGLATCGMGVCSRSVLRCVAGVPQTCTPGTGSAERCNGLDDDCDGMVDEDYANLGMTCTAGGASCAATGSFVCRPDGSGTQCSATFSPMPEVCNGLDDDCDGVVDNPPICGACTDDGAEPNDFLSTARAVPLPYGPQNLQICFRNPDFYALGTIPPGVRIIANAIFNGTTSNIDLRLLRSDGTPVATSTGTGSSESIRYDVTTVGAFVLHVFSADGSSAPYRLSVFTQPSTTSCVNDAYEINDGVSSALRSANGTTYSGNICPSDEDWFEFSGLTGAAVLNVRETSTYSATGNIELQWLRYGAPIGTSATTANDELIRFVASVGGTYQARVFPATGSTNTYALSATDTAFSCTALGLADPNEDDDSAGAARALAANTAAFGRLCDSADWFDIGDHYWNDEVELNLEFRHARGNLELALFRGGSMVAGATSTSDNERISFTVPFGGGGRHYARITSAGTPAAQNQYRFGFRRSNACSDDVFEPNNSVSAPQPAPLDPATNYAALLCPGDRDFYDIGPVGPAHTINVLASFGAAGGNIDLRLYRDGTQVAAANTTGDNERITFAVVATGNYAVEAFFTGTPPGRNAYTIRYDVTRP